MFIKIILLGYTLTCCCKITDAQLSGAGQAISHQSSMGGPPVGPRDNSPYGNLVNIHGDDGIYLRRNLYLTEYTVIDGNQVLGTPFLYNSWVDGTILTPDNRTYSNYQLKYDVYHQTLYFLNGHDSLEVNEEIKEFTLTVKIGDTTVTSKFINSTQLKGARKGYYEMLIDDNKGALLKLNSKIVTTNGEGILTVKSKQYLNLQETFYYFDKSTKKSSKISVGGGNVPSILKLSEEEMKQLQVEAYNLGDQGELMKFFHEYFKSKKKAF